MKRSIKTKLCELPWISLLQQSPYPKQTPRSVEPPGRFQVSVPKRLQHTAHCVLCAYLVGHLPAVTQRDTYRRIWREWVSQAQHVWADLDTSAPSHCKVGTDGRFNEKCRGNNLRHILAENRKAYWIARKYRWTKGNTETLEHSQDLAFLWNDSALPNKLTLTQTKPRQYHPIPCWRQITLDLKTFLSPELHINSEEKQKHWGVGARQGSKADPSQGP